jgi:hypothetical protein
MFYEWVVDDAKDAAGRFTIRLADGTIHGNTEMQPIATVFQEQHADEIVRAHNSQQRGGLLQVQPMCDQLTGLAARANEGASVSVLLDEVYDLLSLQMACGNNQAVGVMLQQLPCTGWHVDLLLGVLTVTLPRKRLLRKARTAYFNRVREELVRRNYSDIDRLLAGLE